MTIDKEWVVASYKAAGFKSATKFGLVLGLDKSQFTKALQGQRDFRISEACAMAKALNVPIEEVLRRLGYIVPASNGHSIDEIAAKVVSQLVNKLLTAN
jgi:hypothetical protein